MLHFHLTGFGPFHGVAANPSQSLMENFVKDPPELPAAVTWDCQIIETAGRGATSAIQNVRTWPICHTLSVLMLVSLIRCDHQQLISLWY